MLQEVNQSTFSMADVEALRPANGGSNDAARRTWLAKCPADLPARPKPGDPLEKFKQFILAAYEDGRWCVRFGQRCCFPSARLCDDLHFMPLPLLFPLFFCFSGIARTAAVAALKELL